MQAMTLDFYQSLNFKPIVPPKSNRKSPWIFDKVLYKLRNKIERLFRKIKRFRRIFTRYDKLDSIFLFFIYFAFIFDATEFDEITKKFFREKNAILVEKC